MGELELNRCDDDVYLRTGLGPVCRGDIMKGKNILSLNRMSRTDQSATSSQPGAGLKDGRRSRRPAICTTRQICGEAVEMHDQLCEANSDVVEFCHSTTNYIAPSHSNGRSMMLPWRSYLFYG